MVEGIKVTEFPSMGRLRSRNLIYLTLAKLINKVHHLPGLLVLRRHNNALLTGFPVDLNLLMGVVVAVVLICIVFV